MKSVDKVIRVIGLSLVGFIVIGIVSLIIIFMTNLSPVDINNEDTISFTVESGWSKNKIIDELKSKDLIKSKVITKLLLKLDERELYAGTYNLSQDLSTIEILDIIENQKSVENETITVTFIEGKTLVNYVKQISETFGYTEEEIMNKLNNEEYLTSLINKYWFLTTDILNSEIYYPLEGYLFPDTYVFKKNSTIEEIIDKFLSNMDEKLSVYKEDINVSGYSVHQYLTLASIVEKEGTNSSDRGKVAGVFYNRIRDNWTLGSDVTTYYGAKVDMAERDLYMSELKACNAYNTSSRSTCPIVGLPVGPICNAGLSSISASIEPIENEYYYFVADKEMNTYFNVTEEEHNATVNRLKNEGKWYEY